MNAADTPLRQGPWRRSSTTEATLGITTLDSLKEHLQWALALEHATLPPYLTALYSLKEGHNLEAVEIIKSVAVEEMLHMSLVANMLNAIGGSPVLDDPSFVPSYPTTLPHSDESFVVPQLRFCPEAIEVFLQIERPAETGAPALEDGYATIGQFYLAIEQGFDYLAEHLGESELFCGDPARQIGPDTAWYGGSGRFIAVTDLASARAAIVETIEQGEGMDHQSIWDGDRNMFHPEREEIAHFFRFSELLKGRRYQRGDTAQSGPSGEPIAVDWQAVHPAQANPRLEHLPLGSEAREKMTAFAQQYSNMLRLLQRAYNGEPEAFGLSVGLMYELKPLAVELMQLPVGEQGETAGISFAYLPAEADAVQRKIVVRENGPYIVHGDLPLLRKSVLKSADGEPLAWRKGPSLATDEGYALCRCGQSATKPFCDGSHDRVGFDGTESAATNTHRQRSKVLSGDGITVYCDGSLCMHAKFCFNRQRDAADLVAASGDVEARTQLAGMLERCPSGTYSYALEDRGQQVDIEPDLPQEISIISDGDAAGPLWVSGGVSIERADGAPVETRNRATLCRCGHSKNKPFCDGAHAAFDFRE